MADRALFNRYPGLKDTLPFVELGQLPTSVHRLSELEDAIGIDALWVKRDDLSARDYGGNKVRKLEFLLAAAKQNGYSAIVTFGGLGSNHALATSLNCKKLGLRCYAILTPEPATDAVRNTLRYHQQLGTHIEIAHHYADTRATADRIKRELGEGSAYEIPFGGSSWLGAIGFVSAGLELADQVKTGMLAAPDHIYLPCGTAGSVAGLALGLKIAGLNARIEALQVTPLSMQPEKLFADLFREANRELSARSKLIRLYGVDEANADVRVDQLGGGYAIPTEAGQAAATLLAQAELPSSLTYTAKAMAGLMADAGRGLLTGKKVLFWNTYNSRPYPELPSDDSWKALPEDLHPVFDNARL